MSPARLIARAHVFVHFTDAQCLALAEIAESGSLEKGEFLMHQGDTNHAIYVVMSGRLEIALLANASRISDVRLAECGPEDVIGEYSALDGLPVSSSVKALEDAELVKLPVDKLHTLLDEDQDMKAKFYRTLLMRLIPRLRRKDAEIDLLEFIGS